MKRFFAVIAFTVFYLGSFAQVGIGTTSPNTTLDVRGSLAINSRNFSTTSETVQSTDYTLLFTGTSACTLTLPDATVWPGRIINVKNTKTSSVPVLTIATTSSQTIDGASSWSLEDAGEAIYLVSDGSNWKVLGQSLSWSQGGNTVGAEKKLGTVDSYALPFITANSERMRITNSGNVGIGTSTFNGTNPERLIVDAGTDGTGAFQNVIVGKGNTNSYAQLNIQNSSSGTASSSDVVATANNGTESVNYIDMGINGGGNTSSGILGSANTAYLYSTGNDFAFGNATSNKNLLLFTGGTASSNERIRITSAGNVGVGNITPNSTFEVNGSVAHSITTTSSNLTLGASHYTVIITSGTPTITLPAAASSNNRRVYVLVNQTALPVTIATGTYLSFAGLSTNSIPALGSITIQSNGSNWYRIQ